jgi:hypothetical protein
MTVRNAKHGGREKHKQVRNQIMGYFQRIQAPQLLHELERIMRQLGYFHTDTLGHVIHEVTRDRSQVGAYLSLQYVSDEDDIMDDPISTLDYYGQLSVNIEVLVESIFKRLIVPVLTLLVV